MNSTLLRKNIIQENINKKKRPFKRRKNELEEEIKLNAQVLLINCCWLNIEYTIE